VVNLFPPLEPRQFRALQIGIAASVLLHALVLFLAPGFRTPPRHMPALPTLSAVLRSPPPSVEPASAPKTAAEPVREAQKPPPEPKPKAEPPRPKIQTPQLTTPTPQAQAAPATPASTAPATPAATAPAPVTASETKSGSSAATAQPPPVLASSAPNVAAASSPADPDALEGYKVQLAAFAAKYKRYPATALESHWEGIAEVKLTIGADGRIREAVIVNSSGHDVLDKVAIDMVRKAAPLTEIKPALRNKEFSINLPIVFNIERKSG
jgi:periplasmic protein TonB